jgi:hypothetical protein
LTQDDPVQKEPSCNCRGYVELRSSITINQVIYDGAASEIAGSWVYPAERTAGAVDPLNLIQTMLAEEQEILSGLGCPAHYEEGTAN